MSERQQIGTFFGIPVVVGEGLYVGDRFLGVVDDWDEIDKQFKLVGQWLELDQVHVNWARPEAPILRWLR